MSDPRKSPLEAGTILGKREGAVYRLMAGSPGFVKFTRRGKNDRKPVDFYVPESMLIAYAVRYATARIARVFGDLLNLDGDL